MISREIRQGDRILTLLQEEFVGYHPLIGIARIAHTTEDERLKFDCHKTLSQFIEPTLKSVEVSTAPPDSEILKVIFEGEFDVIPTDDGPIALEHKEKSPVEEVLDLEPPLELRIDVA